MGGRKSYKYGVWVCGALTDDIYTTSGKNKSA